MYVEDLKLLQYEDSRFTSIQIWDKGQRKNLGLKWWLSMIDCEVAKNMVFDRLRWKSDLGYILWFQHRKKKVRITKRQRKGKTQEKKEGKESRRRDVFNWQILSTGTMSLVFWIIKAIVIFLLWGLFTSEKVRLSCQLVDILFVGVSINSSFIFSMCHPVKSTRPS